MKKGTFAKISQELQGPQELVFHTKFTLESNYKGIAFLRLTRVRCRTYSWSFWLGMREEPVSHRASVCRKLVFSWERMALHQNECQLAVYPSPVFIGIFESTLWLAGFLMGGTKMCLWIEWGKAFQLFLHFLFFVLPFSVSAWMGIWKQVGNFSLLWTRGGAFIKEGSERVLGMKQILPNPNTSCSSFLAIFEKT